MDKVVYCCTGTCRALVSEEEFLKGVNRCGTEGCTCQGEEFEKRIKCGHCGEIYKEGEAHSHTS